jgi:hypothetical protein
MSISQHVGWPQPITPLIARQPKTIPYPMWYNTTPSFVPMDPNMYSMYYLRIKGPSPLIFGKKKENVINVIQPKQVPPIEKLVQNQYPIKIPTLGLEQLIPVTRGVLVPQVTTFALHVNIPITIGLLVYSNGVPIWQPKKVNSYPQPSGESPNGG